MKTVVIDVRLPLSPKLFGVDLVLRDSEVLSTIIGAGKMFAYAENLATTLLSKAYAV